MNEILIDHEFKFHKGDIIVVGCSTGPDSMALMDMLLKIRLKYDLSLICAHVNHNIRKESYDEAIFMQEYCKKNDICFETMLIEHYGDDNFHNEARNIRYSFFEKIVAKYNANYLMTAHHGDDLIETILMRIVRGSNLNGYSGFKKIVDMGTYHLVRPLISFTKDELLEYDNLNNVPYFIDSSNSKMKYTRNRYRKVVLPFLKEEDKNVHKKFYKFSENLICASEFIEKERNKAVSKVLINGKVVISKFLQIDDFLQREILYFLMEIYYQDDLILLNDRHVELLQELIKGNKQNATINLPNDVIAVREYDYFYLRREMEELTNYEIELGNSVDLPNHHTIKRIEETNDNSNNICRLSSDEVRLPLTVRTRKMGDRIAIKGMNGTKKLKDIFIDMKIGKEERDLWPVVVDSLDRIVWIPGIKKSKFDKKNEESYDIILKYC